MRSLGTWIELVGQLAEDTRLRASAPASRGICATRKVQGFFGLLLQQSNFDANREVNNGRGAVDFKLSMGASDKSLIEFKLAKSSSLKRNVKNQLAIYERANKTNQSVMVVIAYTEADMDKVARVLREAGTIPTAVSRSIVVIDARADNKPSASTV